MAVLTEIEGNRWNGPFDAAEQQRATAALEAGSIVYLPALTFEVSEAELRFFSPDATDGKAKNISHDPRNGRTGGTSLDGGELQALQAMMRRYAQSTEELITSLFPAYAGAAETARTSFRPVQVSGRALSPKKDDSRLHVDAFPSQPTGGRRILRIFTNVNRTGEPRVWQVGGPFEAFAGRFVPRVNGQLPGSAWLQQRLGITKSRRTPYDHIMMRLHDGAKSDDAYQSDAPKTRVEFAPGSTWLVYTDRVLHAALGGQHLFEQTFHLEVAHMQVPAQSPLRILENMKQKTLVN
jgi:hypothetical protein